MADTSNNIPLPKSVWVDLYAVTGITVGTELLVQNQSTQACKIYAGATPPADLTVSGAPFKTLKGWAEANNDDGDLGAWAISLASDGLINVAIV